MEQIMGNPVSLEIRQGVAWLTMDDGKVNVMSVEMLTALGQALDQAERDARLVVLRSARPGIFSAGFDLKVFAANDAARSLQMVKAGAELATRLMTFPMPTLGVMEGYAFPMGTFLLLACDVRLGLRGPYRMGLNEVVIRIAPPSFAVELARSRVHPAWLSRTVTLGEMFAPDDALTAGFLDKVVSAEQLDDAVDELVKSLANIHLPSHIAAKQRLRGTAVEIMRAAIAAELTLEAYQQRGPSGVALPMAEQKR
jgi:enoyl-CoA hydratase/carnithine racemase